MPVPPTATYRLQFTPDFGFRDAIELIPYLDQLGISHVYASPLLKPAPGSMHGYDVIDPTRLNPELGDEEEFQELLAELARHGMGLILDIVPNHMAVNSQNEWWQDVLEHGQYSRFANYFDIDWGSGDGKVVLPTLGDHFGTILESGELKLDIDDRGLAINYYENRFPVAPSSYEQVLVDVRRVFGDNEGESASVAEAELDALIDLSRELDARAGHQDEISQASANLGRRTWNLYRSEPVTRHAFNAVFVEVNGDPGDPESFNRLERLLNSQHYRLTFWRRASEEINYRRFFDIADLISLRIEDPEVFDAVHSLILEYAGTAGIDGFRADHVDGLLDPEEYAERLYQRLSEASGGRGDYLLLFEKILTGHEQLPSEWPISGTTGYEFAHRVNAVLADPDGFRRIEEHYAQMTGLQDGFEQIVHSNKAKVLDDLFSGQFQMLVDGLYDLATSERQSRDLSRRQLSNALREIMVRLPVYRTYVRGQTIPQREYQVLQGTLAESRASLDEIEEEIWTFLGEILLGQDGYQASSERVAWVRRWQQFTGPLMAKGLEDTALYVYTPLTSLNEVGGEPEVLSPDDLHAYNSQIAADWPHMMLTTSTHDTKRSEDVRARVAVLSELAEEWLEHLDNWRKMNASLREAVGGVAVPDANEEQLIYQTLLGAWPLDPSEFGSFRDRVKEYLTKAMREAKVHSSWIAVNEEHEQAVLQFVDRLLDGDPGGSFFRSFVAFQTRIASYGAWNSLSQLTLKLTSPGFPDIYQGQELWDYSLADPDNRRPVDYQLRQNRLDELDQLASDDLTALSQQWRDGRIKLLVTNRLLKNRKQHPEPYASGEYVPLSAEGECSSHVIAFARRSGNKWAISVVPRRTTGLVPPDESPVGSTAWGDTRVVLPNGAPSTWVDVISGNRVTLAGDRSLGLAEVFASAPVAVLRSP
jgi:(1->4)-alpha-D-glucan 1-alpha-D-glucosylmutase